MIIVPDIGEAFSTWANQEQFTYVDIWEKSFFLGSSFLLVEGVPIRSFSELKRVADHLCAPCLGEV